MNAMSLPSFWEGFCVESCEEQADDQLLITLRADPAWTPRCGGCGAPSPLIHDRQWRRIRERDLLDRRVWLKVELRRVDCLRCGRRRERVGWLDPRARVTRRLQAWIEALTQMLPIRHVCALTGLHWQSVKDIDKRRLVATQGAFEAGAVRRLVMDEFALHKGHRYATVIMDAQTLRVLWVGEGNSRKAIAPFFALLGDTCRHIEAVAMDMNTAFDREVRTHCPQAEVVYDLFHVVARFGREVIDRVRVDQANALRQDKPARHVIKRSRWLLLRNRENLQEEQAVRLRDLLAANQPLATVYLLKTTLKEIWYAPSVREGWLRWRQWQRMAEESGIPACITFARRLKPYLRGILASAKYHLHTSVLEGVNNRIKVIKRMAYGFRDSTYFFLKIKAAFPGKA